MHHISSVFFESIFEKLHKAYKGNVKRTLTACEYSKTVSKFKRAGENWELIFDSPCVGRVLRASRDVCISRTLLFFGRN